MKEGLNKMTSLAKLPIIISPASYGSILQNYFTLVQTIFIQ
jgi:hypothetical protein